MFKTAEPNFSSPNQSQQVLGKYGQIFVAVCQITKETVGHQISYDLQKTFPQREEYELQKIRKSLSQRDQFVVFTDSLIEGTEIVQKIEYNGKLEIGEKFEFNFLNNQSSECLLKPNKTIKDSYLIINNSLEQSQMSYELFQIAANFCQIHQTAIFNCHGARNSIKTLHVQILGKLPVPIPKNQILTIKNSTEFKNLRNNINKICDSYQIISNIRILPKNSQNNQDLQIIIDFRHPYFLSENFNFENILCTNDLLKINQKYEDNAENQDLLDLIKTTPHSGPDCFMRIIYDEHIYLKLLFDLWENEESQENSQNAKKLNQRRIRKLKYILNLPSELDSYSKIQKYIEDNPICILNFTSKVNNFVTQSLCQKLNLLKNW